MKITYDYISADDISYARKVCRSVAQSLWTYNARKNWDDLKSYIEAHLLHQVEELGRRWDYMSTKSEKGFALSRWVKAPRNKRRVLHAHVVLVRLFVRDLLSLTSSENAPSDALITDLLIMANVLYTELPPIKPQEEDDSQLDFLGKEWFGKTAIEVEAETVSGSDLAQPQN